MRTLAFILFLCSCQGTEPEPVHAKAATAVGCIPYFVFDAVDHYRIAIDEAAVWSIEGNEHRTQQETELLDVLLQYGPEALDDTSWIAQLEGLGFAKRTLPSSLSLPMQQLFCERDHPDFATAACVAIWRDILIFRNEGRIIGTAKLCFDCYRSSIHGTSRNTHQFGGSGDFARLDQLLQ